MAKVGFLSLSDGRTFVHTGPAGVVPEVDIPIGAPCQASGHGVFVRQGTYVWPHAFWRMDVPIEVFLPRFGASGVQAAPGDTTAALSPVCKFQRLPEEHLDA